MSRKTAEDALQTKKDILDAAYRLFGRDGYEHTSLSNIAAEAGVTRGAIYWHFQNKGDLLIELLQNIDEASKLSSLLEKGMDEDEPDPLGRLKDWLNSHAQDDSIQFFSSTIFAIVQNIVRDLKSDELEQNADRPAVASDEDNIRQRLHKLFTFRYEQIRKVLINAINKRQLPPDFNVPLGCDLVCMFLFSYVHMLRAGYAENILASFSFLVENFVITLPTLVVSAPHPKTV